MRILVVEDEKALREQLTEALGRAEYAVDVAADGDIADERVSTERYDAIVLDLGLPGIDGLSLLDRWRHDGITTPVLVLTARSSWHDKVQGIDRGADDYVAKPFQIEEVLARVRALIRRAAGTTKPVFSAGALTLDPRDARVTHNGQPVKLTSHEYRVLAYLLLHQDRVVSQSELTEHIYAQDFDRDSNTVEVFIARLRRKLGADAITTVRGLGYRIGGAR